MTFQNFDEFLDWLLGIDEITVLETSFPQDSNNYVTLEDLRDTNPIILVEVLVSAYDSGYHFGAFFADRYNGMLTIRE